MTESQFFHQYRGRICKVRHDSAESGDYRLYCPEDMDEVRWWRREGYKIASIYETENGEDIRVDDKIGEDINKVGYFILEY